MNLQKYWNNVFKNLVSSEIETDDWLEKHLYILNLISKYPIIDLGCGDGRNTIYLYKKGFNVIACDFSREALKIVNKNISNVLRLKFDFSIYNPFDDNSIRGVIADLSLHYFDDSTTKKIIRNLYKMINKNGVLICRVESDKNLINMINYNKIEENYYISNGIYKRVFNSNDIDKYFCLWDIIYKKEMIINKYDLNKVVWEIVVKPRKSI